MAITLYHAIPSANSERVKIVLHEKKLTYKGVLLSLARRDQKKPEFLKLNPYGKVPVIDDDGHVLFESCVINDYLDEKYPTPPLMPADPYLRARGRVLVDYALNHLHESYWLLRSEMRKKSGRDETVVAERQQQLKGLLGYLEEALSERPFFLGGFSLVDINIWPRIVRLTEYGVLPDPALSRLTDWLGRMNQRSSVQAVLELTPAL